MSPAVSKRIKKVHMPPIHSIMGRVRDMKKNGETVWSMAQAVPWYDPPQGAWNRFMRRMKEPGFNFYSPDPGRLSTRRALAGDFLSRRGMELDPRAELHLTCGASQAFLGALVSVTDAGDKAVVLEPYYFDHVFALQFTDLNVVPVPMVEGEGWEIPWETLGKALQDAAVMVLVNPGNPTGSALSLEELRKIVELTEECGCALIIDETYERFNFTGSSWHPWEDSRADHVITLGSFSKSFSLSGWRLGYLFGSADILEQALKVQDSVVICPPTPSQILLEECLQEKCWVEERSREVNQRLTACRDAMKHAEGLDWREAGGGFFTLAAAPLGVNGYDLAEHLLDRYAIASIPGEAFGPGGNGHVRLSFGCLAETDIEPAMESLASVDLTDFAP